MNHGPGDFGPPLRKRVRRRKPWQRASDHTPRHWPASVLTFKKSALRPNGEHPTLGPRCKKHGTQVRSLRRRITVVDEGTGVPRSIKIKAPICRRCELNRGANPKWAA